MLKGVCVGAGYFSKFHFEAWNRIPEVKITAVCDIDITKAQEVVGQWGLGKSYDSVEEMIRKELPDFIDIITPPKTHYDLIRTASEAGVHVICQKPIAPSYNEAVEIAELVRNSDARLMVHENWRFQPWYRKIKSLLEGEEVIAINHRMRMGDGWQPDAYMGRQPYFRKMERLLIHETGIHFIDTFRFLAGEITSVDARLRRLNDNIVGEDFAWVHFDFESGAMGFLDANRYHESLSEEPRLTFGEMLIETRSGSIRLYQDGSITSQKLGEKEMECEYEWEKKGFAGDCVFNTQIHFIQSLMSGTPFETNIEDYLRNLKLEEAIYRSDKIKERVSI